jgi:hypothetical protein
MKSQNPFVKPLIAAVIVAGIGLGLGEIAAGPATAKRGVKLPFTVYEDKGSTNNHYVPSGWMGDIMGIKMDEGCTVQPHGGKTCLRFDYAGKGDWAGVVWQDPVNDWGEKAGGWNLTGAKKLSFWARGEAGGENPVFKFGILEADKKFPDSSGGESDGITLTKEWKQYSIELSGKDLNCVKTGFAWTLAGQGQNVTFYLDDIQFE